MKRLYVISLLVSLLGAVSCVQEEISAVCDNGAPYTFVADLGNPEAKAILEPGVTSSKVRWEAGDEVAVFAGEDKHKYVASSSDYTSDLEFTAMTQGEQPTFSDVYYAVHPYDESANLVGGGIISTTLPSVQTAEADNFSYHLAVAKATDNVLSFRNVCGLVRVDIKTSDITSVVFKGLNDEVVAGNINVKVSETPSWEKSGDGAATSVTLVAPSGAETIPTGVYYFAVLPQTFEKGFQITANRNGADPIIKTAPAGIIVERGKMVGGTIDSLKGSGTESDPYILTSAQDMVQMRTLISKGVTTCFKLGYDIDMTPVQNWVPVNTDPDFTGVIHFDGNNKTIRNFASSFSGNYPSLFGVLKGSVKNLRVENASVTASAKNYCGIIAGISGDSANPTLFENVSVSGTVVGNSYLGGLVGDVKGAVFKNCSADVVISSSGTDVGGFAGIMTAGSLDVENCSSKVEISGTPSGNWRYGGLFGYLKTGTICQIKGTDTKGKITGISSEKKSVSGMVAYIAVPTRIIQSYTSFEMEGSLRNIGGLCGVLAAQLEIRNCYSQGDFKGSRCVGGLVGINESGTLVIKDSFSSSKLSGNYALGGLVGISANTYNLSISNSVAWNPSITSSRTSSSNYSSGAVVGAAIGTNTFNDCLRNPDMNFSDSFRTLTEHGDLSSQPMPLPEGVTDVNQSAFDGKSADNRSLSFIAQDLGWSSDVWDFSGSMPTLRPYVSDDTGGSDDSGDADDEPSTITPPEGWTTTIISSGLAHHALEGLEDITGLWQSVHALEVDLNNPRYTIKFSVQPGDNGRSTTSACQVFNDAVAAVNATYERGSVFIKVDGSVASAIPNDEISDTGVANWKSEAGLFMDSEGKISIEYVSKDITAQRNYYSSHACPNIFSSAPMLIDDYETVGASFVNYFEGQPDSNKSEHPYKHQSSRHPRTAVALTKDNHLILVTIDGRGTPQGMSAKEVTLFLQKHFNPQYAINMDGGGSTAMSIKGKLMNDQDTNNNGEGERAVPTHILVYDSKQ